MSPALLQIFRAVLAAIVTAVSAVILKTPADGNDPDRQD